MKKREQGILSVEASIVLTLLTLFILFLFSFGRVYRAQNLVSHATLQTADAVAMESYLRETALQSDIDDVVYLASSITDSSAISAESLESLRSADLPKIAKQKFVASIASSESKADEKLKKMGVKDGLAGVDFSECKMDLGNDDVIIAIKYTVEMQFPVFGADEIEVTKTAKAKTFGEILFEVSTKPNVPGWGTTSGDNKVVHGSTVEITATPNYGYVFVSWDDGVTDNPRTVTVTEALNYTAIFKKDKFGVNLYVNNADYGSVSGAGNYEYLDVATISATPKTHYYFEGWDDNGDGAVDDTNATRNITVDKTYDIKAIFKPVKYTVTVKVNNSSMGTASVKQGSNSGVSIQADYGSNVELVCSSKDSTLYKFKNWSNGSTNTSQTVKVEGNAEYTANFENNTSKIRFYNGSTKVHETSVIRGSSIDGSKAYVTSSMPGSNPTKSGATFNCWKYNGNNFSSATTVPSNQDTIDVYASWKYTVTLDANGGTIGGSSTKNYSVNEGGTFNFSSYKPSRSGWTFNGWYSGSTNYSGNITISSNVTVKASWSCNHPSQEEYDRSGSVCSGGTIYYRCSQCHGNKTTGSYGGTGHSWTARCNRRHKLNWFNGKVSGGCGVYHDGTSYSFCQVCVHCSKLRSGYNWCCSSHMLSSAAAKPKRYPSSHNYNKSWVEY